ncbi:TPA: hypothetical protein ACP2ND_001664, partial [Listeria monocytogenes]
KKRISSIFNPENITFTNNIGSTDLVISDTLDQKQALPIFFIYDLQNKNEWSNLISYIQKLLIDKLFE